MPTPSKRHLNWTGTGFTPAGGSLQALTGVRDIRIDPKGNLLSFSGDGDHLPTTKVNDYSDPTITVQFHDLTAAHALAVGARGAFASTHNDAKNGATVSGGGYTANLAGAIIGNIPTGGAHRAWGEASILIEAESSDGLTSPLSFTPL